MFGEPALVNPLTLLRLERGPTIIRSILCSNCGCGLAKPGRDSKRTKAFRSMFKFRNRIVNGYIPNIRPWLVQIMVNFAGCGGSIINKQFILTAAHCFCGDLEGTLCL